MRPHVLSCAVLCYAYDVVVPRFIWAVSVTVSPEFVTSLNVRILVNMFASTHCS